MAGRAQEAAADAASATARCSKCPSLAETLDILLPKVDFLSIGTNDLTQFLFAADRAHPKLAERYDWLSPSILRFLRRIVARGRRPGVPVGVCGEMGGRTLEAMALIGIGLTRFSITPAAVGPIKAMIRSLDARRCCRARWTSCSPSRRRTCAARWPPGRKSRAWRWPEAGLPQAGAERVDADGRAPVDDGRRLMRCAFARKADRWRTWSRTELGTVSVGERLRLAREAKGLSLDDVARQTRIPIRHLEHIEREEWDALPATTYSVGFARSYANAVGLDGAAIGAEVREQLGGAAPPRRRAPITSRPIRRGCRRARSPSPPR